MDRPRRYTFVPKDRCVMCGSSGQRHKVLGRRLGRSQGRDAARVAGVTTTVMRCTDCGLIYSNPQPVPYDLQDHYGVVPESYWRPEYFHVPEGHMAWEIAWIDRLLGPQRPLVALDIGAGIGRDMVALRRNGFEVYGIEPSTTFHQRGIERMGMDPARFLCVSLEDAEFPEARFDLVSFGVVLEHIYDPAAALEKAMRWTRPGGLVHISVPSADWLVNRLANLYYKVRGTGLVANLSPMHPPYHLHEFTPQAFEAHGRRHGYEVAQLTHFVCRTFLPGPLDGLAKAIMRRTRTGMEINVWLRKQ